MLPPLQDVETFCPVPTLNGVGALLHNVLVINEWLAVNNRFTYVVCGFILWIFPIIFTWPIIPFKYISLLALRLMGFEKTSVRKNSPTSQFQRDIYVDPLPQYSTFPPSQSAAPLGDEEESTNIPIYAWALGWIAGILAVRAI